LFSAADLKAKLESFHPAMPVFSSELLPQFDRVVIRFPSARVLARLAEQPRHSFFVPPLEPIYLREPHITIPK
jgi:hypothetical protein